MTTTRELDAVVIGGGPAGSTVSTIMAQRGLNVALFERERFPRFHIGESLIPETYWVLKRLNMLAKMQQSHFIKKYSVQFVNSAGKLSAPFYFWDNKPHECSQTWQVVRSEFDKMMLDNAREHGVDVHEATRVVDVLFDGDRAVGVTIQNGDGRQDIRAKVVVDASGQNGILQNRFDLRVWDPMLDKSAVWTYWKGAYRDTGKNEGATMVLQTADKHGWFWYIPLHDDTVSVGVVAPSKQLLKGRGTPEQIYTEEVEKCPGVQQRIGSATRVTGYFVTKDYSYRAKQAAGDGWVLIGDAYAFLDPLYSSGVLLALALGRNGRRRDRRRPRQGRRVGRAARALAPGVRRRRQPHAAPGLRVLRRLQLRPVRAHLSRLARHGHRSADRRSVHRSRRQGVGADGVALPAGQAADPGVERSAARRGRRRRSARQRAAAAGRPGRRDRD